MKYQQNTQVKRFVKFVSVMINCVRGDIKIMKLGAELELKDQELKTSTLEARKIFFELILQMKPEVSIDLLRLFNLDSIPLKWKKSQTHLDSCAKVFLFYTKRPELYYADLSKLGFKKDVRETPLLSYFEFIFKNQSEFDELLSSSEKECKKITPHPDSDFIVITALTKLIPDWKTLHTKKYSERLISNLSNWAKKWNLNEDWCLDFALDCLRHCKINLIDKFQFPDDFLTNNEFNSVLDFNHYQQSGSAWYGAWLKLNMISHGTENLILEKIPNYPFFEYKWKENDGGKEQEIFQIRGFYNPITMLKVEFRQEMEQQFWSKFFDFYSLRQHLFVGMMPELIKELKNFQTSIENYISEVELIVESITDETVNKKEIIRHIGWMIEYQIPPFKSYSKLSEQQLMTRKGIESGVKEVCKLIGLTLRKSSENGRPKGSKDSYKRRRVSSF